MPFLVGNAVVKRFEVLRIYAAAAGQIGGGTSKERVPDLSEDMDMALFVSGDRPRESTRQPTKVQPNWL